jgi:hypothetical protein
MENTNLKIYNIVRSVPKEAQKSINAGRLKGMTDINPMWRIKVLTETFGPVGIGWYYDITDKWLETNEIKGEVTANVSINLFIKENGEWSKPIQGIGGSMLVTQESKGPYVNDECYKMALTDAISVACKALGVGADIYWGSDNTKYNDAKKNNANYTSKPPKQEAAKPKSLNREDLIDMIVELCDEKRFRVSDVLASVNMTGFEEMSIEQLNKTIDWLESK